MSAHHIFRLEEETIMRSELESQTIALKEEMEKLKQEIKSSAELRTKSESEQVDILEEKLKELENKRENDMFALQEDLIRKEEAVLQLEASVEKRALELTNCQKRLLELENELDCTKQRTERQLGIVKIVMLVCLNDLVRIRIHRRLEY